MNLSKFGLALKVAKYSSELRKRERWSRDALAEFQRARISSLVREVSAKSPFYRRHWGISPGDDVSLEHLTPLRRATLMENFDDAVTDPRLRRDEVDERIKNIQGDPLLHGEFRVMSSSGSTGERGRFVYDQTGWATFLASVLRWSRWMGLKPSLPRLRVAAIGAPDAKHMTYRGATSIDLGLYRTLRLSATEPLDVLVDALNRHQPDALNAYPSVAALLAEEQLSGRLRIKPRILCTSSEQRTGEVTSRLRRAFGVTPFDCYALTETGITATDCDQHEGLHVYEDLCIVEIVDDAGKPVIPGEVGARVLMTNLYNTALPMIRVEVSDMLVEVPGQCGCGRSFKRLSAIEGRADDVLTLRDIEGRLAKVHPIHLRTKLVACSQVVQYRVTVGPSVLELEAVCEASASAEAITLALTSAVEDFFLSQRLQRLPVAIRLVDAIARETGVGKLKVVRQVAA